MIQKISIVGILSLIFFYGLAIISTPLITPEIGYAYVLMGGVENISQALHKFTELHETWYRPFSFYISGFLIFQLIDFHSIALIKLTSYFFILLNGYIVSELARKIFDSPLVERILIVALVISHPLYYNIAFEGSAFSDSIFTIFLNLFLICFINLLKDTKSKTSEKFTSNEKTSLIITSCILLFCTVTSHERGLCIFLMIGLLYLFFYQKQIFTKKFPKNLPFDKHDLAFITFAFILFLAYVTIVYAAKHQWSGEHYRTTFEPQYILPNLIKALELPLRLFFYKMNRSYDAHCEPLFNLFAAPLVILLLLYIFKTFKNNDVKQKNNLKITLILFFCSLIIPIFFGSSAWHFYTAGLYLSILTGRALFTWINNYNKHLQSIALSLFFILLIIATIRGVRQEIPQGSNFLKFMLMTDKALNDKVLKGIDYKPEVVYYDTGELADNTWPFGGQGKLFRYFFKDLKITEIALVNGKVLEADRPLCKQTVGKKSIALGFNFNDLSWRLIEEKNYCAIL